MNKDKLLKHPECVKNLDMHLFNELKQASLNEFMKLLIHDKHDRDLLQKVWTDTKNTYLQKIPFLF